MNETSAFAALIEDECDALVAAWKRRLQTPSGCRRVDGKSEVPALLSGGHSGTTRPAGESSELVDGTQLLSAVVVALKRNASGVSGADAGDASKMSDAHDSWLFDIDRISALSVCLYELAASHGFALDGRAFEVTRRELDLAILRAVRRGMRNETDQNHRTNGEQLAFAAHDLRAPLNAIALATDVLERVLPTASDDTLARRMLRSIRRNVDQLSVLADQVLDTNGASADTSFAPERRPMELCPLVRAVVQELEPLARSTATRVLNAVPEGLIVHADGELLARVFQNLVSNAIDHAPGGEVIVGAEVSSVAGDVVCWVRDDGAGIAPQEIERVFRKGETTRPECGARGLGLPIVEQVVEAHGGRIAVESAEGFGATFWFELPALVDSATSSAS